MGTAVITFNIAAFRTNYPVFAVTPDDATLQSYWNTAINFISPLKYGWLNCSARELAINLLTAHIATIANLLATGEVPQIVKDAQIDKVSIGLVPPPSPNAWSWWMNTTPYGQECMALLTIKSVGGLYVTPRCNWPSNRMCF